MISKQAQEMGMPDLTAFKAMEQSTKELINQYQIAYLTLQKKLSDKLQKAKTETDIAIIRLQRQKTGEAYEQSLIRLRGLLK